ncbi:MAG: MFS transporter [Alphaproteobacteria bacterium]|nr:MFS transporter [Alphaproteobacteria bacterium]
MKPSVGYLALVRDNPAYRRLWLGEVVSYAGDWFGTIALFAAVGELTDSALAVTGVVVCQTLPHFLAMPLTGPLVDRLDRRRLLIGSDLLRVVAVLGQVAAHLVGSLVLLYLALLAQVLLAAVFIPARAAALPAITTDEQLPSAVALSGGTWSVMLAVGAALGGLTTAVVGIDGALLANGLTFAASAALLAGLPDLPPEGDDGTDRSFAAGLGALARDPYLALVASSKAVMAVCGASAWVLPLYGDGAYPLAGPLGLGALYAARGAGAAFGSLGMRRWTGDTPPVLRAAFAPAFVVLAVSQAGIALAPTLGWCAAGFLVAGAASALIWVFGGTLLQLAAPPGFRGRVFAVESGVLTLGISLTSALAGALVDHAGWTPDTVTWVGTVGCLVVGLPFAAAVSVLGTRRDAAPA